MNPEDFLEHFGTKGMKWGVRRDKRRPSGYSVTTPSGEKHQLRVGDKIITIDAARANELKRRSKAHGVSALNNDDLKFLNERVGLETKYMQFFPKKKSLTRKGADMALDIMLNVGKQQATSFLNKKAAETIATVTAGATVKTAVQVGKHMKP